MANVNSNFSCAVNARNTGAGLCPINPKNLVYLILAPKRTKLTTTTLPAFKTALKAFVLNANKASRGYPVGDLRPMSPSGGDTTKQTFSTGQEAIVKENNMSWPFQFVAGGIMQLQRLRAFNVSNTAYDFFFVDSNNFFLGQLPDDGSDSIQAISSDGGYFWARPWAANDGSKIAEYSLECNFQPKYINELYNFVKLDIDITAAAPGILDAFLSSPSANVTAGKFNIAILDEIGTDLVSIYGSNFVTTPGMIVAYNTTTGVAITPVTSNVVVPATANAPAYLTVTLPTTAPPYPASGTVSFTLDTPTNLATAGMAYYEGNTIAIAKS